MSTTAPARARCEPSGFLGDLHGAADLGRHIGGHQDAVDPPHHIGSQQVQQCTNIPAARCSQERLDDLQVFFRPPGLGGTASVDSAAGAACRLLGGVRRSIQKFADGVERHCEHIVQHKRDTLCGREPVKHYQQCSADRVGEHSILLGPGGGGLSDALELIGIGERLLWSPFAGSQLVQRLAGGDGGEPTR
jgi:hypothetical protein